MATSMVVAPAVPGTSPLSSMSSPSTFYTANGSPSNGGESTDTSSLSANVPSPYRAVRRLPRELREHCQIYLEEQLCMCNALVYSCFGN